MTYILLFIILVKPRQAIGTSLARLLDARSSLPECLQVSVKGMHCSSCSSAVERVLKAQPGVFSASVALLSETAEVADPAAPGPRTSCAMHV